jgi:hypothetical protein
MDLSVFAAPSGGGPAPDALAPHLAPHLASRRIWARSFAPAGPGLRDDRESRCAAAATLGLVGVDTQSFSGPGPGTRSLCQTRKGWSFKSTAIADGAPEEIVWGQSGPGRAHSAA